MKEPFLAFLLKLLAYFSFIMTPIAPALMWLVIFVFFDLVTGVYKARKMKTPITSRRLTDTVTKIILYFIAIIASHVMDVQFLKGWPLPWSVAQLVTGLVGVAEFKSIIENVSAALGIDVSRAALNYLKGQIKAFKAPQDNEQA